MITVEKSIKKLANLYSSSNAVQLKGLETSHRTLKINPMSTGCLISKSSLSRHQMRSGSCGENMV